MKTGKRGFTTAQRVAMALNGEPVPACQWRCLKCSGAPGMCMNQDESFICTLPKGHDGPHVACCYPGTDFHTVVFSWKNHHKQRTKGKTP